jgi:hypothetical protein
MSKASNWAKVQCTKPKPFRVPDDKGKMTLIAQVEPDGDLSFNEDLPRGWTYTPKEARALARWILDTFDEIGT